MKTPSFWYDTSSSVLSMLLTPFAALYTNAGTHHRETSTPQDVALPVICMGNLVAGGSGKTPAIQKYLEDPVAEEILKGEVPEGGTIIADYEGTGETLTIKAKKPKAPSKEKKSE